MGARHRRRRRRLRALTPAEAHLRAQCDALEQPREREAPGRRDDDAGAAAEGAATADVEIVDVAALERERLFASHPRAEDRRRGARSRSRRTGQDSGR